MNPVDTERRELEHHQLEQRFAGLRVPDRRALERLCRSLERSGQLSPCIAVAEAGSLVLLDGYRRLAALHRLGHDTVWVQLWHCPLAEALARLLASTQARAFAPLEEALLLRELANDTGVSQHELARRTGRDVSWVSRRLKLLSALSEELLEAVCQGRLSSWAAVRIFAPLAAPTPSMHARCAPRCRTMRCRPGSWNVGTPTTAAPTAPPANASSRTRSCSSRRSTTQASEATPHACARGPRVSGPANSRASPGDSSDCAAYWRWCAPTTGSTPSSTAPSPVHGAPSSASTRSSSTMPATLRRELRQTIRTLRAQGTPLRQISRLLGLSRNTVRRLLRACPTTPYDEPGAPQPPCPPQTLALLERLFTRCRGNVVRVHEVLATEHQLPLAYSTLTRWVREAGLRAPPRRAGSYTFDPGAEMHHDTSPHRLGVAGQTVSAQCAAVVLAYSRRLFMRYYPRFTRFEAKAFLADAFVFMDGTCTRCVIDNTSVLVASGAGADATIAPEMAAFARAYGVTFWAHAVNHPDRKARVERPFAYIEGNFLAGRSFSDWDDLNAQALTWCIDTANAKPKRVLGMRPEGPPTCSRSRTS